MNKFKLIFLLFVVIIFITLSENFIKKDSLIKYKPAPIMASQTEQDYKTTFIEPYRSQAKEPSLESLQCPIPKSDRVKNYTGIQCVYASIEMLGRWAEEPKLINPPITSRSDCKGYSSPERAAQILSKLEVKFEQSYGNRKKGIELIKKAMKEGRGVLWGVPGHAMVLIHYDEENNRICWVDNSDKQLRVQETTIEKFKQRWNSWVLIIYPDNNNKLFSKLGKNINLPIVDHENKNDIEFIPFPN